jgi:hypothetical protein
MKRFIRTPVVGLAVSLFYQIKRFYTAWTYSGKWKMYKKPAEIGRSESINKLY